MLSELIGDTVGDETDLSTRETFLQTRFVEFLRTSVTYLVETGFRGYNLVRHAGQFCAAFQTLGAIDFDGTSEATLQEWQRKKLYLVAETLAELKLQITDSGYRPAPELIELSYRGYNLVRFRDRIFALSVSLGALDLGQTNVSQLETWEQSHDCVIASSLEELKARVDELVPADGPAPTPESPVEAKTSTLGDTYREYRISDFEGMFYAIPCALGPLNLAHPAERNLPEILSSRQRERLRTAIDSALDGHVVPKPGLKRLEGDQAGFRRYVLNGLFVASHDSQGDLDLELARSGKQGKILAEKTAEGLKRRIEWASAGGPVLGNERVLLVAAQTAARSQEILERLSCKNPVVLARESSLLPGGCTGLVGDPAAPDIAARLRAAQFDLVIVPYEAALGRIPWESLLAPYCRRLLAVFAEGEPRLYEGDDFSRIVYNMAYLRSMYKQVPSLNGLQVLEVGCSDGLPCDLVSREQPSAVVGVDMLETVGLRYQNPRSTFRKLDATVLPFPDRSFDLAYSIATLEHVPDPLATLREMKRVLRRGCYGYVQTAPLYYSPFGHHMFGYFDQFPWIHVRLSKTEIAEYALANGIAARIQAERGCAAEHYIDGMINLKHINGKLPHEYGVETLASDPDVEIVAFAPSYEGKHLLSERILEEARPAQAEDLIAHGFELVFRVK